MSDLFTRHSKVPFTGNVFTHNGKPFFIQKRICGRCGGAGRAEQWAHTGYTCYDCNGKGHLGDVSVKLYTAEQIAKMDATAGKRQAKRDAANEVKAAARAREAAARADDFHAVHGALIARAKPHMENDFIRDVMTRALANNMISEKQAIAVSDAITRIETRNAMRAASRHVGKIGERLETEVTVSNVASFDRPCFNASWRQETVWIITMRDADMNAIISKSTSFRAEKGEKLHIRATIKEHGHYNDEAQTTVQRIKVRTNA